VQETPAARRRAIAFMVVAAICWSSGGFLVRQLGFTDAWEIVFWRSLFMAAFVAGVLLVMHGARMPAAVRAIGKPGLLAGACLACTFFFFIASLTRTTVANTFVLMSVAPFLAALAGKFVLREAIPLRTGIAMGIAFGGIVVMFADSVDSGRLIGNLLALAVPTFYAAEITVLRMYRAKADMLPMVMVAGLISIVVALPLALPFQATGRDLGVLAVMGCVQLGVGCLLGVAAARHLTATEIGLLSLLEPILGPLWVWALMGEHPGNASLIGGAIVLGAVAANEAIAAWRGRGAKSGAPAPPPPIP
jgi:drug/metabolite transporter (DMT)-like permease